METQSPTPTNDELCEFISSLEDALLFSDAHDRASDAVLATLSEGYSYVNGMSWMLQACAASLVPEIQKELRDMTNYILDDTDNVKTMTMIRAIQAIPTDELSKFINNSRSSVYSIKRVAQLSFGTLLLKALPRQMRDVLDGAGGVEDIPESVSDHLGKPASEEDIVEFFRESYYDSLDIPYPEHRIEQDDDDYDEDENKLYDTLEELYPIEGIEMIARIYADFCGLLSAYQPAKDVAFDQVDHEKRLGDIDEKIAKLQRSVKNSSGSPLVKKFFKGSKKRQREDDNDDVTYSKKARDANFKKALSGDLGPVRIQMTGGQVPLLFDLVRDNNGITAVPFYGSGSSRVEDPDKPPAPLGSTRVLRSKSRKQ